MNKKFSRGQYVMTTFLDNMVLEVETYDTDKWVILIPRIGPDDCPIGNFMMIVHEDSIRNLKESDGLAYNLYKS